VGEEGDKGEGGDRGGGEEEDRGRRQRKGAGERRRMKTKEKSKIEEGKRRKQRMGRGGKEEGRERDHNYSPCNNSMGMGDETLGMGMELLNPHPTSSVQNFVFNALYSQDFLKQLEQFVFVSNRPGHSSGETGARLGCSRGCTHTHPVALLHKLAKCVVPYLQLCCVQLLVT